MSLDPQKTLLNSVKKGGPLKYRRILHILAAFLMFSVLLGAEDFSKEKAFEHIKYMAGTIGPRPMGSPQEMAALKYTAEKLAEYGCQVEWQHVPHSVRTRISGGMNTNSGNVIGRLQGQSNREIVIGAHIDSAGPEIPGANDDVSGVAAFLEIARVISKEPHYSTYLFVAFGGEESGLVGSNYFVENYPLENVALMLQLDMASNDSPLMIWIETTEHQSPEWLVSASIDAYHALGYRNIVYPTHFQSLNGSLGGAGSDHEPFMRKGIPAVAFVSDVRFPIHTRNDSVENFQVDGLERSGNLILELLRKFDREQPESKKGHYMLLMLGEQPIFIPPFMMMAFVLISIVITIFTLIILRKRRQGFTEDKKIKKSWPKLLVLLLIITTVVAASDWVLKFLKGQRFYWYAHPGPHLLYLIPFTVLGIWLALQVLRKWRLRRDAFFYLIRSSVYLFGFTLIALAFVNARLALYPASGLFLLSLACLLPWGWLKGVLFILSPYLMIRLFFIPQLYEFIYRGMAQMGMQLRSVLAELIFSGALIFLMILFMMPFLLGFAAVYRSYRGDLFGLKRFRLKWALVPIAGLILLCSFYLMTLPSYTSTWEQEVRVNQRYNGKDNSTFVEFVSFDYLKGINAVITGQQETVNRGNSYLKIEQPLDMSWVKDDVMFQTEYTGEDKVMDVDALLEFERQPFTVNLKLECDLPLTIEECSVEYRHGKDTRVTMVWYSFPPKCLRPQLTLRMAKDANLTAEVTATFLETPLDISCRGDNKHFIHRAIVTRDIELKPVDESAPAEMVVREEMVDVGDHRLHGRVFGKGSPAVILISGFMAPQTYWDNIVPALAERTTVVTYDRAGYFQSELGKEPCTGHQSTLELKTMLDKLDVQGPYVVVGHSYGGKIAKLFTAAYPDQTRGTVLIDSSHEDWVEDLRAIMTEAEQEWFDGQRASRPGAQLPGGPGCENAVLDTTQEQLRRIDIKVNAPLIVMTASDRTQTPFYQSLSEETQEKFRQLVLDSPKKHLELSRKGKQIIVENTGHNIHIDQPQAVIDAILSLL
jgi:pimeloyl-ACP methyl ester carboxylesterase